MHYSYVADHVQYLASIGFIAFAGEWLWKLSSALGDYSENTDSCVFSECRELFHRAPYRFLASSFVLYSFGMLTWNQGHIYKDAKTLWLDTIQKNPNGWMAYNNLGTIFGEEGDSQQALSYFEKAVSLNTNDAETHHNSCLEYKRVGRLDLAIQPGLRVVALRPEWSNPYTLLGAIFQKKGELKKAASCFRAVLERNPKDAQVHYRLGLLFVEESDSFPEARPQEAVSSLEEAAARKPTTLPILNSLARALASHPDPAIRNSERSVKLAEVVYQRTHYRSPIFLDTLAAAYAETRQFAKATAIALQAVELSLSLDLNDLATQLQDRVRFYRREELHSLSTLQSIVEFPTNTK